MTTSGYCISISITFWINFVSLARLRCTNLFLSNDQFIHEIRHFLHSWGEIIPQLDCIMELLWSRFDPDRCQGIKDWLINSITEYVIGINIETLGGLDWDWFFDKIHWVGVNCSKFDCLTKSRIGRFFICCTCKGNQRKPNLT